VLCCLGLLGGLLLPGQVALAGGAQYVYDELGRVVGAVTASGGAESYAYDADGNILNVAVFAAGSVAITGFSPSSGVAGTVVTLQGMGFDPVSASNTITFNGVAATVTQASATQLTVAVPAGASTGPIRVTNAGGTATSSGNFTVEAAQVAAPQITSFTPAIGVAGTTVTISGTGFMPAMAQNAVQVGGANSPLVSAAADTLAVNASASGKVSVTTPYGSAISIDDFFAVPGGVSVADVGHTGRVVPDAAPTGLSLPVSKKAAVLIFDGMAGQLLGLGISPFDSPSLGAAASIRVSLYSPAGGLVKTCDLAGPAGACDLGSMPTTGTYTLLLLNRNPGSDLNASVYLSTAIEATIGTGAPMVVATTRPGQNARHSFTVNAPSHHQLSWSGSTFASGTLNLLDANGQAIAGESSFNNSTAAAGYLDLGVLASGTYTVAISPNSGVGQMALTLTSDSTAQLVVDGPATAVSLAAGQGASYRFNNSVLNQNFGLLMGDLPAGWVRTVMSLHGPQGGLPIGVCVAGPGQESCNLGPLGIGTHVLRLAPAAGAVTGSLKLMSDLYAGVLPLNGGASTVTLVQPGQNAAYSFTAEANQPYLLHWSDLNP